MQRTGDFAKAKEEVQRLIGTVESLTEEKERMAKEIAELTNIARPNNNGKMPFGSKGQQTIAQELNFEEPENADDVAGENRKLVRQLWVLRQSLDQAENEKGILEDEKRVLEHKFGVMKSKAEKYAQNDDSMMSMEDILEENATLMEENVEITAKHEDLMKERTDKEESLKLAMERMSEENDELKTGIEDMMKLQSEMDDYILQLEQGFDVSTKESECFEKGDCGMSSLEQSGDLQDYHVLLETLREENDEFKCLLSREQEKMAACLQGAKIQRLEHEKIRKEHSKLKKMYDELVEKEASSKEFCRQAKDVEKKRVTYVSELEKEIEDLLREIKHLKDSIESCEETKGNRNASSNHLDGKVATGENLRARDCCIEASNEIRALIRDRLPKSCMNNHAWLRNVVDSDCATSGDADKNSRKTNDFCLKDAVNVFFDENERVAADIKHLINENNEMRGKVDRLSADNSELKQQGIQASVKEEEIVALKSKLTELAKASGELKHDQDCWKEKYEEELALEVRKVQSMFKERLDAGDDVFRKKLINSISPVASHSEHVTIRDSKSFNLKGTIDKIFDTSDWMASKVELLEKDANCSKELRSKLEVLESENAGLRESRRKLRMKEKECAMLQNELFEIKKAIYDRGNSLAEDNRELEGIHSLVNERLSILGGAVSQKLRLMAEKTSNGKEAKESLQDVIRTLFDETERLASKSNVLEKQVEDYDIMRDKVDSLIEENSVLNRMEDQLRMQKQEKELEGRLRESNVDFDELEGCKADVKILEEVLFLTAERLAMLDYPVCKRLGDLVTSTTEEGRLSYMKLRNNFKTVIDILFDENETFAAKSEAFEKELEDVKQTREHLDTVTAKENARLKQAEEELILKEKECLDLREELSVKTKKHDEIKNILEKRDIEEGDTQLRQSGSKASLRRDKRSNLNGLSVNDEPISHSLTSFKEASHMLTSNDHALKETQSMTVTQKENRLRCGEGKVLSSAHEICVKKSSHCKAFAAENRTCDDDGDEFNDRYTRVKEIIATVKASSRQLEKNVEYCESEICKLKNELQNCKGLDVNKIECLTKEVDLLSNELDVFKFTRRENAMQSKNIDGKKEPVQAIGLKQKVTWLEGEKQNLCTALDEQNKRCDVLLKQKAKVEEDFASLRSRLKEISDEKSQIKVLYKKMVDDKEKIATENGVLRESYETTRNELAKFQERRRDSEKELSNTKRILKRVTNEKKAMDEGQQAVMKQVQELQQKLNDCETRKSELEEKNRRLTEDLDSAKSKVTSLSATEGELFEMKIQLENAQMKEKNHSKEYQQLRAHADKLKIDHTNAGDELQSAKLQLKLAEVAKDETEREKKEINFALESMKNELESSQKAVAKLQVEKDELQSKLKGLRASLEEANDASRSIEQDKRRAEDRLQQALEENKEMREKKAQVCNAAIYKMPFPFTETSESSHATLPPLEVV